MRLTTIVTRRIIERLLSAQNYRTEIISLIDAEFLDFVLAFFRRVVEAKTAKPVHHDGLVSR